MGFLKKLKKAVTSSSQAIFNSQIHLATGNLGNLRKDFTAAGLDAGRLTGLIGENNPSPVNVPNVNAPTRDMAILSALDQQKEMLRRRGASRTLFGGGSGLDRSPSATNSLLGGF